MLAQLMSLVLLNTYSWIGGQGYCAYDFALHETEEYESLEIVLRPSFDPANTATGKTDLPDETIAIELIGGSRASMTATTTIETDCSITGFTIVRATALASGNPVDLLGKGLIDIGTYKPLEIKIGKAD